MFHLVLLRSLTARGEDKSLVALKGGCNLRFFYASTRYSEDIDFDVAVIAPGTLRNKIERLLRSPLVTAPLKTRGLEVSDVSAPKQTETTQRWKVGIRAAHLGVPLRTKIEFSRRDAIAGVLFEMVGREVLRPYGLTQVPATHYGTQAAIEQKIQALAGRAEPQARDVFDLQLLFARADTDGVVLERPSGSKLGAAIDNAIGISFDEFRSKVVAYLDPEQAALYAQRTAWDAMQQDVVSRLEAVR